MNFDVVQVDHDSKIGTPVTFENNLTSTTSQNNAAAAPAPPKQEIRQPSYNQNNFSSGSGANMQLEANLTPIKNLNPYQTRYKHYYTRFASMIY